MGQSTIAEYVRGTSQVEEALRLAFNVISEKISGAILAIYVRRYAQQVAHYPIGKRLTVPTSLAESIPDEKGIFGLFVRDFTLCQDVGDGYGTRVVIHRKSLRRSRPAHAVPEARGRVR